MTLLAWYRLRQQHLVALAETIENQGVLVRVNLLFLLPASCVLSSSDATLFFILKF